MSKPILCVDFDGVVHQYTSGWKGEDVVADGPVPGAIEFLSRATPHFEICIYSSRSKSATGLLAMAKAFRGWLAEWAQTDAANDKPLPTVRFVHEKPAAFLTIDDRAICFEGDWSVLDPEMLLTFRPWNKRKQTGVSA